MDPLVAADTKLLLDSLVCSDTPALHLLLDSVDHSQVLQIKSSAQEWNKKIKIMLNSEKDRWIGICLLARLSEQCDTETFLENCVPWLKMVTKVLQQEKQCSQSFSKYIAETFGKILSFAVQFSELARDISQSVIQPLLTDILSEKSNMITEVSLLITRNCLHYYPTSVTPFLKRIENLVFRVINTNNYSLSQLACVCLTMMSRCGTTTKVGTDKQVASWELQWSRIMETLLNTVDNLYENEGSELSSKQPSIALDLEPIPLVEPKRTETCVFRIKCLLKCLALLLRNGLSKTTEIPVIATVKLIRHILAVNGSSLNSHVSVESVLLKTCLPSIHLSALEFLKEFIERCQMVLSPFHQVFIKLFLSELSWTSSVTTAGTQQPFRLLRSTVYDCMRNWVHVTSSLGEHSDVIKNIINHVVNDIKPKIDSTKLLAPTPSSSKNTAIGNSSKARKRRLQDDVKQLTRPQEKLDHSANKKLCISGLQALVVIVSKTSSELPVQILKEIQVFVVHFLLECQASSSASFKRLFPIPYESSECRMLLYRLLKSLLYHHNQNSPPPLQHAIQIFSQGTNDQDFQISQFCYEAQMMCNIIIHPRVATIANPFTTLRKQESTKTIFDECNDDDKTMESVVIHDQLNSGSLCENDGNIEVISYENENNENEEVNENQHNSLLGERSENEDDNPAPSLNKDTDNLTQEVPVLNINQDISVEFENDRDVAKVLQGEAPCILPAEEAPRIFPAEEETSCNNNEETDCPPIKKRRTSDVDVDENLKKHDTIAANEDELMKEMIASFVDSLPDTN